MKLAANSVTETAILGFRFCYFEAVHEIREILFPGVKLEIQIGVKFAPAKLEKSKIRKIKLSRKFHAACRVQSESQELQSWTDVSTYNLYIKKDRKQNGEGTLKTTGQVNLDEFPLKKYQMTNLVTITRSLI